MFSKKSYPIKLIVLAIILSCLAAIYCIPYIDVHPQIPKRRPQIIYDYRRAPLKATSVKQYKLEKFFPDQVYGPESIEADSFGNLYLAIDGGFILYAQMNETKPKLSLLAELNERGHPKSDSSAGQRSCRLDEQVYGEPLSIGGRGDTQFRSKVSISRCSKPLGIRLSRNNDYLYVIDTLNGLYKINLNVAHRNLQRSTEGLKVDPDPRGGLLKEKLIEFHPKIKTMVSKERMDKDIERRKTLMPVALTAVDDLVIDYGSGTNGADIIYMTDASQLWLASNYLFDLMEGRPSGVVLKFDTGTHELSVLDNAHMARVRMSVGSNMIAGAARRKDDESYSISEEIIHKNEKRDDFGAGQTKPSEKREGSLRSNQEKNIETRSISVASSGSADERSLENEADSDNNKQQVPMELGRGYGAPRFDSNDVFDDRPLFFPNGIELTDDRQALLIADTSNRRIIKHFIKGQRKGQTDLWTWTPSHPDNIRRGGDINGEETYWMAGCGRDRSHDSFIESLVDDQTLIEWPTIRMLMLKNIYLMGWTMEKVGQWLLRSQYVRDFGYSLKMGISLTDNLCEGIMLLQYNRHGQMIRTIHGRDFPDDIKLLSQITQVNDNHNKGTQHLYLGSPYYNYVYRLTYKEPTV